LKPLTQCGLFALNICTAPPRAEAWTPLLAKSDGTLKVLDPLGSIERNAPCLPTPTARGAPKFEVLPTKIRFGSSMAPGWMYAGNLLGIGLAHAPGGGTLRKVPTCARADAPGMCTATTRAAISRISVPLPCPS
jgi:hypothetical protein